MIQPDQIVNSEMEIRHQGKKLCSLVKMTFRATREMAPLYTMGTAVKPKKKSAVAGSTVFEDGMDLERVPMKVDEIRLTATGKDGMQWGLIISDVEFLNEKRDIYVAKKATGWHPVSVLRCECGAESCGYSTHSHWCPKA
jgi:hypothetical protein